MGLLEQCGFFDCMAEADMTWQWAMREVSVVLSIIDTRLGWRKTSAPVLGSFARPVCAPQLQRLDGLCFLKPFTSVISHSLLSCSPSVSHPTTCLSVALSAQMFLGIWASRVFLPAKCSPTAVLRRAGWMKVPDQGIAPCVEPYFRQTLLLTWGRTKLGKNSQIRGICTGDKWEPSGPGHENFSSHGTGNAYLHEIRLMFLSFIQNRVEVSNHERFCQGFSGTRISLRLKASFCHSAFCFLPQITLCPFLLSTIPALYLSLGAIASVGCVPEY